jgi:dipeptidyl aminopeptidase/acylaminoacyl peptidase
VLVTVKAGEVADGPELLPDGQSVLFTVAPSTGGPDRWDRAQIVAQSLATGQRTILIDGGSDGRYLNSGHLVYARGGVLLAIPFDARRLATQGGPVPIVEGIKRSDGNQTGATHFSVSKTGSLVYVPGPAFTSAAQGDLAFCDRKGAIEKLKLPSGSFEGPRISPNGKQLAVGIDDDGRGPNIWIYELSGATSLRQLTVAGHNRFPIWSPDSERVAFQSDREGDLGIFWQRADGSDTAQRLTKPDPGSSHVPESWSRTTNVFSFSVTSGANVSLWTFSMRDKKATPFIKEASVFPTNSVLSPDGQWLAYTHYDPRGGQVWVEPFPATGAKYLIARGGIHPMWSLDGRTLFCAAPGQFLTQFFSVQVTTGSSFKFGPPERLAGPFQALGPTAARSFDMAPDGRVVGIVISANSGAAPKDIEVVLNWLEELKQRVPR